MQCNFKFLEHSCSPRSGWFVAIVDVSLVVLRALHLVENHKIDIWVMNDSTCFLYVKNSSCIGVLVCMKLSHWRMILHRLVKEESSLPGK